MEPAPFVHFNLKSSGASMGKPLAAIYTTSSNVDGSKRIGRILKDDA